MANQCLSKRFPKAVEQLSRQSNKLPVLKQKKSTADFWLLSWWKKDVTARSTFYEHKFHKSLVVLSTGKAGLYQIIAQGSMSNAHICGKFRCSKKVEKHCLRLILRISWFWPTRPRLYR